MSSIALSRKALAAFGALALTLGGIGLNASLAHADVSEQSDNTTTSETQGGDVSEQDGNASEQDGNVSEQDGNVDSSTQDGNVSEQNGNGGGYGGAGGNAVQTDDVTLSAYTVVPGQTITVSTAAGLFAAGATPDIELHSDVKVLKSGAVANAEGVINEQVTIPLDAELGTHHIYVGDYSSGELTIVADTSNGTGSLAKTGLESGALLAGALLVAGAGAATVIATRRRSAQH